ncbi:MAG: hypothetical protein H0X41_08305 [Chitinophagaceae bacterium]|nr:hypothetical protein [Chitinophagaceae bacterium]
MDVQDQIAGAHLFNEEEWLKLVLLLSDTQVWLTELSATAIMQLPLRNKKKLLRKTYFLTVSCVAHILERHYYKVPRYPATAKFTIPVVEILSHIRNAFDQPLIPVPGSTNHLRILQTDHVIGFNRNQLPSKTIEIISDGGGKILTAYPAINN